MLYLDRGTHACTHTRTQHTHTHAHTHMHAHAHTHTDGTLGGGHGALQTLHRAALSSLETGHAATPRSGSHCYTPEPGGQMRWTFTSVAVWA